MRSFFFVLSVLYLAGFKSPINASEKSLTLNYHVDLTKIETDSFFVDLAIKGFSTDSAVFQFAATAPGTYEIMDVGRFEAGFKAYNASGVSLPVYRISTNQYVIKNAQTLSRITYQIEDSYDSKVEGHPIYPMCGSTIESDNALINGQMVFGYIQGFQTNPVSVEYSVPKDWKIATALESKNGVYNAKSYDQLVDSPVQFGKLTMASLNVGGAKVDVSCYSQSGKIVADSLLKNLESMLRAADKFIGGLPVKRYIFLFKFSTEPVHAWGAWEHNYSSFYILPESQGPESSGAQLYSLVSTTAAHEFFHIVTPLNIHSDIIEKFNFETPTPSKHLWFYEGCTEWAAQMMEVCGGLIDEKEFTHRITQKLTFSDNFNPKVSLVDLALGSYGELQNDYINIYHKGALTAMMLDMRLLELSKGKMGLRDVIRKLSKEYGPNKAFHDDQFFDIFVKMTYPEIDEFFNKYIKGAERLPIKEYLAKAGFDYQYQVPSGTYTATRGLLGLKFEDGKIMITDADSTNEVNRQTGIRKGDELLGLVFNGSEKSLLDPGYEPLKASMKPGDSFAWKVRRDGKEMELKGIAGKTEIVNKHVIASMSTLTKEQQAFRTAWLTNR